MERFHRTNGVAQDVPVLDEGKEIVLGSGVHVGRCIRIRIGGERAAGGDKNVGCRGGADHTDGAGISQPEPVKLCRDSFV